MGGWLCDKTVIVVTKYQPNWLVNLSNIVQQSWSCCMAHTLSIITTYAGYVSDSPIKLWANLSQLMFVFSDDSVIVSHESGNFKKSFWL